MQQITFNSKDNLQITADLYEIDQPKGFLVLCHQARTNRGEYKDTAQRFNEVGYSCLAIDQRSGMDVWGIVNETFKVAKEKGFPTGYLDARKDIEAAVDYAFEQNNNKPIILVGSSYSASLVLLIAKDNKKIKAVIAFSPGEFLQGIHLADEIKDLKKPVFVSSAKEETKDTEELFRFMNNDKLVHFKPEAEGFHGSRALWESVEGSDTVWERVEGFLSRLG